MIPGWLKCALGMAALVLLWLALIGIYRAGYSRAHAEGAAALETCKREYSDANAARWAEYAATLQQAGRENREAQARADALETELLNAKTALADERRGFAKRIADATHNNDCPLSPDVVRLYNEALYGPGYAAGMGNDGSAAGAASPAQRAAPPAAPGAGLLHEQPVTIKDLLAHAKRYGEWAREVHAVALGWKALSAGW